MPSRPRTVILLIGLCFNWALGPGTTDAQDTGTRHLGTPEEAVVGIEVSQPDGSRTLYSLGVVLRCDGFVLAPEYVFSQPANGKGHRRVSVVVNPGTASQRRLTGMLPRVLRTDVPFNVFKIPKIHLPAQRAYLPDGLKAGDAVTICWSDRDPASGAYGPARRREAHIREAVPKNGIPVEFRLQEAFDGVPLGALVLGPGDQAIGMVAIRKPGDRGLSIDSFHTFEDLCHATNLVGASPLRPPAPQHVEVGAAPADRTPETSTTLSNSDPSGKMVKVPGGRVRMPAGLTRGAIELEGETGVCVPDFEIDQYEVTNQEYLDFLHSLPEATKNETGFADRYFPLGWARDDPPFPKRLAKMPVVGVAYGCAAEYARWRGKRLPTPYEWVRAACGEMGDPMQLPWMKDYLADRRQIYAKVSQAHAEYLAQPAMRLLLTPLLEPPKTANTLEELARLQAMLDDRKVASFIESGAIPWIPNSATPRALVDDSRDMCVAGHLELADKWTSPMSLREAGARKYDVSPFGAHDMIMNAEEWVLRRETEPLAVTPDYIYKHWSYARLIGQGARNFVPDPFGMVVGPGGGFEPEYERHYSGAGVAFVNLSTREPDVGAAMNVLRAFHTVGEVAKDLMPLTGCELGFSDLLTNVHSLDGNLPDKPLLAQWTGAYAVRSWLRAAELRERDIGLQEPLVRVTEPPTGMYRLGTNRNIAPGTTGRWRMEYEWQLMPVGFRCAR